MAGGQFGLARMMEKREGAEWNGSSSSRDSGSGTNGKMVAGGNRRKFPSILETLRAIVFSCYSEEVFCSQFRVHGFERKPGSSPCPPQLQNSLGDLANASHTQPGLPHKAIARLQEGVAPPSWSKGWDLKHYVTGVQKFKAE